MFPSVRPVETIAGVARARLNMARLPGSAFDMNKSLIVVVRHPFEVQLVVEKSDHRPGIMMWAVDVPAFMIHAPFSRR